MACLHIHIIKDLLFMSRAAGMVAAVAPAGTAAEDAGACALLRRLQSASGSSGRGRLSGVLSTACCACFGAPAPVWGRQTASALVSWRGACAFACCMKSTVSVWICWGRAPGLVGGPGACAWGGSGRQTSIGGPGHDSGDLIWASRGAAHGAAGFECEGWRAVQAGCGPAGNLNR